GAGPDRLLDAVEPWRVEVKEPGAIPGRDRRAVIGRQRAVEDPEVVRAGGAGNTRESEDRGAAAGAAHRRRGDGPEHPGAGWDVVHECLVPAAAGREKRDVQAIAVDEQRRSAGRPEWRRPLVVRRYGAAHAEQRVDRGADLDRGATRGSVDTV